MEASDGAVGWEGCGGKDPAAGERHVINREAVEPHQVGGLCRRCTVAISQYHLATSEMSRSSKNLACSKAACDAFETGCLLLFTLPCFLRKASRANQRSELFLWRNSGNYYSCRAGGGKTERCWTDEGGEMEGSKRSEALTHSDPSPCFTSSIVGIYTLA